MGMNQANVSNKHTLVMTLPFPLPPAPPSLLGCPVSFALAASDGRASIDACHVVDCYDERSHSGRAACHLVGCVACCQVSHAASHLIGCAALHVASCSKDYSTSGWAVCSLLFGIAARHLIGCAVCCFKVFAACH